MKVNHINIFFFLVLVYNQKSFGQGYPILDSAHFGKLDKSMFLIRADTNSYNINNVGDSGINCEWYFDNLIVDNIEQRTGDYIVFPNRFLRMERNYVDSFTQSGNIQPVTHVLFDSSIEDTTKFISRTYSFYENKVNKTVKKIYTGRLTKERINSRNHEYYGINKYWQEEVDFVYPFSLGNKLYRKNNAIHYDNDTISNNTIYYDSTTKFINYQGFGRLFLPNTTFDSVVKFREVTTSNYRYSQDDFFFILDTIYSYVWYDVSFNGFGLSMPILKMSKRVAWGWDFRNGFSQSRISNLYFYSNINLGEQENYSIQKPLVYIKYRSNNHSINGKYKGITKKNKQKTGYSIYNLQGQNIQSGKVILDENCEFEIPLNSNIRIGVYVVKLDGFTQKISIIK